MDRPKIREASISPSAASRGVVTAALNLDTAEQVLDAIDSWVSAGDSREFKVRKTLLGTVATLFDRGVAVAVGRGRGAVNALANALENYS